MRRIRGAFGDPPRPRRHPRPLLRLRDRLSKDGIFDREVLRAVIRLPALALARAHAAAWTSAFVEYGDSMAVLRQRPRRARAGHASAHNGHITNRRMHG